jgi:ubiquinone/menaquinone biosynthesis C-methylase UbiE
MSFLKSADRVSRDLFEKHADFYDNSTVINNYLERWDREIIALSPSTPLLDIGCGPGRLLNKLTRAGHRDLAGIDIAAAGPRLANEKASGGDNSLSLCEGLAERMPFRHGSFRSVVFSGVFHHIEKPKIVLEEAARILGNSGTLIIADPYFPPLMRQFINAILSIYPITGDRRFYTSDRITKLAKRAGFEKKRMINMPLAYILIFEKCSS